MAKDKSKHRKKKHKKSKKGNSNGDSKNSNNNDANSKSTIPIKLSVDVESNNASSVSGGGGWSWGAAFAVASQIPDDEEIDETAPDVGDQKGIGNISQLANDHCNNNGTSSNVEETANESMERKPKRKRSESSCSSIGSNDGDDNISDDNSDELEGRMVQLSTDRSGDTSLVLVHKQSGNIYSSGERNQDGRRLVIGKLVKGKVKLDESAVKQMKKLDEDEDDDDGPSFPYETNPDDHCETPLQSYKDIMPILDELYKSFGGNKESMKIYDPYFCDGSVVKHLSSLGFNSVYNKKEDCYAVWESNTEPQYDVFLTNPPYSEDHIEKLMKHVTSSAFRNKPWLLLMPQWVHKKPYYINTTTKNHTRPCNPFYIVPKKRYVYLPPANFREKKDSDTHKKSSPFVSMWYCWGGSEKRNGELMNAFRKSDVATECDLARSKSALRDLRRSGGSGGGGKGKKKNKKARTSK